MPSLTRDSPSNDADAGQLSFLRLNFLPLKVVSAPEQHYPQFRHHLAKHAAVTFESKMPTTISVDSKRLAETNKQTNQNQAYFPILLCAEHIVLTAF